MKLIIAIAALFALSSCSPKIIPLTRDVINSPYITTTESNKDAVWDKIIDLFAQKGLPIKLIDRSSGLIVSDRTLFPITIELKDGGLKDSNAFLVVPKMKDPNTNKMIAAYGGITGEWNIRIKENGSGTSININIVNLKYESYMYSSKVPVERLLPSYKSTGVFEKIVTDFIQ